MAGEEAVPVWGIEVGSRRIRAVRAVRRPEGEIVLLDAREDSRGAPGPEGLIAFVRRHRLWGHPLVLALESPSVRFRTVALSAAEASGDDPRTALLEYVHPEPELVELHSMEIGTNLHLVAAEDRARVEGFLIGLERADLPAYALLPALAGVHEAIRRTGLFEGDGVVVRLADEWVDVLLMDGEALRHLALPATAEGLATESGRREFAEDFARLLEYYRTRRPRDGAERIVLLGFPAPVADALGPLLPSRPIPFPGDTGPIRAKGRVSLLRAMELVRTAPAAVGAALAGAASPPRLELALRPLPDPLPKPPKPQGAWLAAAALVLLATGLAFFGVDRENRRLRAGLTPLPTTTAVPAGAAEEIQDRLDALRRRIAFGRAVDALLAALPGEEAAPYATRAIELRADGDGFAGELSLLLPPRADGEMDARVAAVLDDLPAGLSGAREDSEEGVRIRIRLAEEGR